MPVSSFTVSDHENIQKHFGKSLPELDFETFKKIKNRLRNKYHPDKFEKYADETVREMMNERLRELEELFEKMERYFEARQPGAPTTEAIAQAERSFLHPNAQYGFDAMRIEIMATDKDMKYHLFGSQMRWLEMGEKFKIPGTNAYLIIQSDYFGRSIGFMEAVKIYLTFTVKDNIETIVDWFYSKLLDQATSLIIEGNKVKIDRSEMMHYIKRKSFLQIEAGK